MADEDEPTEPTDEPEGESEGEPEGHHCEHCDDIAELRASMLEHAANHAVIANAEEDAAIASLADALEITDEEEIAV